MAIETCAIEKRAGIYVLRNTTNSKVYVGSAVNLRKRAWYHLEDLRQRRHPSRKLQNAWNKYGEDSFEFKIVVFVDKIEDLIPTEQRFIDLFNAVKKGYNTCPTAGSQLGYRHSEETKRRLSEAGKTPEMQARWRRILENQKRPVICNETGEQFESCLAAAKAMNISNGSLGDHLKGKRRMVSGYTFTLVDKSTFL